MLKFIDMDFTPYKISKFNGYAIADGITVLSVVILFLAIKKQRQDLFVASLIVFVVAVILVIYQAICGYSVVKNESDSELKILPDSDDEKCYYVKEYAKSLDGFAITKTKDVYKIGDGVHAKVNKNYTVSMQTIFWGRLANMVKGIGKFRRN